LLAQQNIKCLDFAIPLIECQISDKNSYNYFHFLPPFCCEVVVVGVVVAEVVEGVVEGVEEVGVVEEGVVEEIEEKVDDRFLLAFDDDAVVLQKPQLK
jgi:hypothetical protein